MIFLCGLTQSLRYFQENRPNDRLHNKPLSPMTGDINIFTMAAAALLNFRNFRFCVN